MKDEYRQTWFRYIQEQLPPTFAIITAYNPGGTPLSDPHENQQRDQKLLEKLNTLAYPYFSIQAGNKNFNHCEASYGIDLPLDEAIHLAVAFEQDAIFWIADHNIHLVECANGASQVITLWKDRQCSTPR